MFDLFALALLTQGDVTADTAWGQMALTDLQAIHDTLADNHPGPVDPLNADYGVWLEDGLVRAQVQAREATSFSDYERALRLYVNGFRDGHTAVSFELETRGHTQPGFTVQGRQGRVWINTSSVDGILPGDEILSCDGHPLDRWMAERVDPYHWNADLPHQRWPQAEALFLLASDDADWQFETCQIQTDSAQPRDIVLNWSDQELEEDAAPASTELYQSDQGYWVLRVPSFVAWGEAAERMGQAISGLREHAASIQDNGLLIDVRHNGGGNSAWGNQMAQAIWGEPIVDHTLNSFDWTVDWRASEDNAQALEAYVPLMEQAGQIESAQGIQALATRIRDSHQNGLSYMRSYAPASSTGQPPLATAEPTVFVLTDHKCGSACLDFMDVVVRMPNVTHIGLPTHADAIYMDINNVPTPSGAARLYYAMKVYRNRVRDNNEWYAPDLHWEGGELSDSAVQDWAAELFSEQR